MKFTIIAQSTNITIDGIDEKVSLVKLNNHLPMNWFGSYVYLDDIKIRACLPRVVGEYDLILHYNCDVIGKQIIIAESDIDKQIGRFNSPLPFLAGLKTGDIKLYKLNSRFKRGEEKYIPVAYVASEKFYNRVWKNAIRSQGIKTFRLKSSFSSKKVDSVIRDLQSILSYAEIKYGKKSLECHLLKKAVEQLIVVLEEEKKQVQIQNFIFYNFFDIQHNLSICTFNELKLG